MTVTGTGTRAGSSPWWRTLLKFGVSSVLMVFLLRRVSIPDVVALLRDIEPSAFGAAILCFFLSNFLGAYQWNRLLRASGIELGFARAFRFYFVGLFFNNFLPANIGGDAVKVYDVTRVGSSVYQVIAVTLLDRIIGIFSLCVLASAAALTLIANVGADPYGYYLAIFAACMIPPAALYFSRPLATLLRRIVTALRPLSLDVRMSAILDHLSEFRARGGVIVKLVGLSLVIQALRVLTHVLVGVALGVSLDRGVAAQFFVFVPLLGLAMIPPVTINGLGIREGLGILLFAAAGLAEADAFTLEFLTWLVSVGVSLIGFVFFLARRYEKAPDAV